MRKVSDAVNTKAVKIEKAKHDEAAANGGVEIIRRGHKAWHESKQVGNQNKQRKRTDERNIAFVIFANNVFHERHDHRQQNFKQIHDGDFWRWDN